MTIPATFINGSPLHGMCLLATVLLVIITVIFARRERLTSSPRLRRFLVWCCVGTWLFNTAVLIHPAHFDAAASLPLHFCNLANLVAAVAIAKQSRTFQGLIVYWAFCLCIWAFLTPTLNHGPASLEFWAFWAYHAVIPVATAYVLVRDGFRPTWADFLRSLLWTLAYMAVLMIVDFFTGWNYGFVGNSVPDQKTLIDSLGPYPLRILWMALLGAMLFAILTVAFRLPKCCGRSESAN